MGRDLEGELAQDSADALVVDFMLFGALANAERSGIPTAAFVHTLFQVNREGGKGAVWDERDLATTNETRRGMGLAALPKGGELWDAVQLMLVLVPKAFDRPAHDLPDNVHYVGPVLEPAENRKAWDLPWAPNHPDPLVLVSFSTTYMAQEAVLQRALDAVARLRIRVLVTTGPSVNPSRLIPAANTVVRSHVDHQTVLPHTAAVVTHAGFGTVMAALTYGVPLLCLPMGRDQGANGEHVEACGAGRTISPDAGPEEMRTALSDVLESPRYKQGARSMARVIKREGNGSMVVPLLESLLPREAASSS